MRITLIFCDEPKAIAWESWLKRKVTQKVSQNGYKVELMLTTLDLDIILRERFTAFDAAIADAKDVIVEWGMDSSPRELFEEMRRLANSAYQAGVCDTLRQTVLSAEKVYQQAELRAKLTGGAYHDSEGEI